MAQAYKPGEIVPQSGIYTITHDRVHARMRSRITPRQAGEHAFHARQVGERAR